jgi:hypothetical protein
MKMNAGLQKKTKRTKRACIGNCFEQVVEPENLLFQFLTPQLLSIFPFKNGHA